MSFDGDHVNPQTFAHCYRQRIPLPGLLSLDRGRNVSFAKCLETIATTGQGTWLNSVIGALGLDRHVSVATAARLLLDRLRSTGQHPDTAAKPVVTSARDDIEALGQLARCYQDGRPVSATLRVGGSPIGTALFLDGCAHDRHA